MFALAVLATCRALAEEPCSVAEDVHCVALGGTGSAEGLGQWQPTLLPIGTSSLAAELPGRPAGAMAESPLSVAEVDVALRRWRSSLEYCYQREFVRLPELAGTLWVTWEILPNGSVGSVSTACESPALESVGACIARTLKHIRFQSHAGPAAVASYPITFARDAHALSKLAAHSDSHTQDRIRGALLLCIVSLAILLVRLHAFRRERGPVR